MRIFTVPAEYASYFESEVSRLAEHVRLDAFRREHGEAPTIPDIALDEKRRQPAFVVVGVGSDSLLEGVSKAAEQARARGRREKRTA